MLKCASHYYGLSINELRQLAYQFAVKLDVDFPGNWIGDQMAGKDWYRAFFRRHPKLTLRTPEQTSLNRVKAFCKANMEKFSSISRSTSRSSLSIFDEVGPLHGVTPKKPSNRGRKPMSSSVLTAPEVLTTLKKKADDRAEKKAAKAAKDLTRLSKLVKQLSAKSPVKRGSTSTPAKPPAKRGRPSTRSKKQKSSEEEDEDEDFCIICMKMLPKKLTASNSVHCNECDRPVHLKCADMRASYFTCANCASDVE